MKSVFRHTTPFALAIAIIGSQLRFVQNLKYCTEFFQLEDGSMCTMAMVERNSAPPNQGIHVLTSSNNCCASIPIEANTRVAALVKDSKPLDKSSLVVAILHSVEIQSVPGLTIDYTAEWQTHPPPISQLIVQSSILLI
ncbi:MAG: hypothetical protein ACE5H0_07860 [Bacteroidota bacterium]